MTNDKRIIAKTIMIFIILIMIFTIPCFAEENLISFSQGYYYNSYHFYELSKQLVERYKEILSIEIIGKSTDGNPIYVVSMTDNIKNYNEEDYVNKMHLLVEAGLHSRETYNSFVVIKMIEDYAKDYYNNDLLPDINVKELLKNNMIHFIVSSNPDGYDLTKLGLNSIQNQSVKDYLVNSVSGKIYSSYKANLRGVDLNRNFEDIYYNTQFDKWINQWNVNYVPLVSDKPSSQFYSGPTANSEAETQILAEYFLRYDFRAYLSYHSQGRVIYYNLGHLSNEYNKLAKEYASIVSSVTNYTVIPPDGIIGYGYASYFAANNSLKPFITVETTAEKLPTTIDVYQTEYEQKKLYKLPAELINKMQDVGYFDYKIYVNDKYVRDIMDKEYAYALAKKLNGKVIESKGKPVFRFARKYEFKLFFAPQDFNIPKNEQINISTEANNNQSITVNLDNPSEIGFNIKNSNKTDISLIVSKGNLIKIINYFGKLTIMAGNK